MYQANNIYTYRGVLTLLAYPAVGYTGSIAMRISDIGNNAFKLKSIFTEVLFSETVTAKILPWELNLNQFATFEIGAVNATGVPKIAHPFTNIVVSSGSTTSTGMGIQVNRPTQLKFDNYYISDFLPIAYYGQNWDPLLAFSHNITIIIEIEPLI